MPGADGPAAAGEVEGRADGEERFLGRISLAALSDRARVSRQGVVTGCLAATGLAVLILVTPAGGSAVVASALFVLLGFFGIGWYGPWVALVTEAAPEGRTGFALGLAMAVNQAAIVLVPPLLGLLRDGTGGFTVPWLVLLALIGVSARR